MTKFFIWLEETKEHIDKFLIGYMIIPTFNIKRSFREQVNKCTKTKFGARTQPHIKTTFSKIENKIVSIINVL